MDHKDHPHMQDIPYIELTLRVRQTDPLPPNFEGKGLAFFKLAMADCYDDQERHLGYVGATHDGGCDVVVYGSDKSFYFHISPDDLWEAVTQAIGYHPPEGDAEKGTIDATHTLIGGAWAPSPPEPKPVLICSDCGREIEHDPRLCAECGKTIHPTCAAVWRYQDHQPYTVLVCHACEAKRHVPAQPEPEGKPSAALLAPNYEALVDHIVTHVSHLDDIPKPHVRFWPEGAALRKRRVRAKIRQWIGMRNHYYVSFEIEPNPIWNGEAGEWQWARDDREGQFEIENSRFDGYLEAKQHMIDTIRQQFQPLDHYEIEIDDATHSHEVQQYWYKREGD